MPTIISGTTGIDKIAPGAIEFGDLPSGSVLQVVQANTAAEVSSTSVDVFVYNFQCAITPLFATSKILVLFNLTGMDTGGTGRIICQIFQSTTSGGVSGTALRTAQIAQDSTSTNGIMSTGIQFLTGAIGSTTTQYFKNVNVKGDNSTTWYAQRFGTNSTITLMEIAA